jgi:hypothetical protein
MSEHNLTLQFIFCEEFFSFVVNYGRLQNFETQGQSFLRQHRALILILSIVSIHLPMVDIEIYPWCIYDLL